MGAQLHMLYLDDRGYAKVHSGAGESAPDPVAGICSELTTLVPWRLEPMHARLLRVAGEHVAMVALREPTIDLPRVHAGSAKASNPQRALAEATLVAAAGDGDVFDLALPRLVEAGYVRSAIVIRGEEERQYGRLSDVGWLLAVRSQLATDGQLVAATDDGTYRVLRYPGVDVALVSEGVGTAWVEVWCSMLLEANRMVL
jgi:hypothetical protein